MAEKEKSDFWKMIAGYAITALVSGAVVWFTFVTNTVSSAAYNADKVDQLTQDREQNSRLRELEKDAAVIMTMLKNIDENVKDIKNRSP